MNTERTTTACRPPSGIQWAMIEAARPQMDEVPTLAEPFALGSGRTGCRSV